jgi:hypothetical protein
MLGALALAAPIHIMIVDHLGLQDIQVVFSRFSLFNWLVFILASVGAILVLEASHWMRILLPALTVVVIGHHFIHWQQNDASLMSMSLATVGFLALNVPLLHPNILSLMSYPERRWWREAPRKIVQMPIFLGGCLKGNVRSTTYEISESGAFVTYPPGPEPTFQVDEVVSVCLTIGVLKQIRCVGRVVRIADATGRYPRGLAVEFSSLDWESRRDLKRFVR